MRWELELGWTRFNFLKMHHGPISEDAASDLATRDTRAVRTDPDETQFLHPPVLQQKLTSLAHPSPRAPLACGVRSSLIDVPLIVIVVCAPHGPASFHLVLEAHAAAPRAACGRRLASGGGRVNRRPCRWLHRPTRTSCDRTLGEARTVVSGFDDRPLARRARVRCGAPDFAARLNHGVVGGLACAAAAAG